MEDVNKKFDSLKEAESRGWVEEQKIAPRQRKVVKVCYHLIFHVGCPVTCDTNSNQASLTYVLYHNNFVFCCVLGTAGQLIAK